MYYFLFFLLLSCIILSVYLVNYKNKSDVLQKEIDSLTNNSFKSEVGFWEKLIEPIIDLYSKFNFILYFIFAILFYILASFDYPDFQIFKNYVIEGHTITNIFTSIGTVILSSGVFSSITKSRHFLNIFNNEIKKIVYTEQFISKQKNIEEIWTIVTKSVCNENFHKISDKLFDSIKTNYLPINQNFYYQDFDLELLVNVCEVGTDYVIIEEKTRVELICENKNKIDYRYSSNIDFEESNPECTTYEVLEFKVNNKDKLEDLEKNITYDNCVLKAEMKCELSGFNRYSISRIEKKKYSLKLNPNRVHSAAKIYNNFQLAVYYPKDFRIKFVKLGLHNKWDNVEIREIGGDMKYLKTKHDGIFFQNQGYMLNFLVI